ncbi:hypothetical protein [Endozoicomonas numazuensis]|uniref:Uncharacterized protein n=1 Tax=Endozoicomonas numazuensis TaxID=1137799 RepID=A0A081NLI0_9GAMM|nr:hypothetical protein [Endozoicomonas numazuensis]KEQ19303.1 hypothetical protein GZ78_04810 [Endozoicomonas numazuensis]
MSHAHAGAPALSQQQLDTLSALLSVTDTPHEKTFDSMVNATQKWRRRADQERWEVADLKLTDEQKNKVMEHLEALGLIKEMKPDKKHFDYALVLGGTAPRMKSRFQHLVKLWNEGVRFDQIIFLSGQRPTQDDIDQTDTLVSEVIGKDAPDDKKRKARPATEKEAAEMVYMSTKMPDAMKHIKIDFFSTDRFWLVDRWQRGNTRDSIKNWVASHPKPGSAVIVSNQPHLLYQQEVIRQELPKGFTTQATARQSDFDGQLIMYLDALALWLHNLQVRVAQTTNQEADRE